MPTFLHIGCGRKNKSMTTPVFGDPDWTELRYDIDPSVKPDIIGSMLDMSAVETGSMDAIFSSHNIEHLYPHEVPAALAEFRRVLKPDGYAVITCPDLQSICALIVDDKLTEPAYESTMGPISPLDILYGHVASMKRGNIYMAHRSGFTQRSLTEALTSSGFAAVAAKRRASPKFDLWALATAQVLPEADMMPLARSHFP
jgi:SAM-dependent methyltransferase